MKVARTASAAVVVATCLVAASFGGSVWALGTEAGDTGGVRRAADLTGKASVRLEDPGPGLAGQRMAQLAPERGRSRDAEPGDELFGPITGWLAHAQRQYQRVIVRRLSTADGPREVTTASPERVLVKQPEPGHRLQDTASGIPLVDAVQEWMDRAQRDYRRVIIRGLAEGMPGQPEVAASRETEARQADEQRRAAEVAARQAEAAEVAARRVAEEAKRAQEPSRQADEPRGEGPRVAEAPRVAEEPPRRQADEMRAPDVPNRADEPPRKEVEDLRQVDAKRAADEAARKQVEELRKADAAKRAAEEGARKQVDDMRKASDAAKRTGEAPQRQAQLDERRLADEKRAADDRRIAAEKRAADDKRASDERRAADERRANEKRGAGENRAAEERRSAEERGGEPDRVARLGKAPDSLNQPGRTAGRGLREGPARSTRKDEGDEGGAEGRSDGADATCGRRAGRMVRTPGTYITRRNDSLHRIAMMHYGTPRAATDIWRANRSRISDPDHIQRCVRLRLPLPG